MLTSNVVCVCMCGVCPQLLLNQPVMVKPAEAEKNLAWEAAQAAKQAAPTDADLSVLGLGDLGLPVPTAAAAAGPLRLQVSGFKQGLGENEIRQIFEPFGAIDSVSVVRDASGQALSLAFVVFRSAVDGRNAMTHWHGQSLLDHVLNVTATAMDTPADNGGGVAALVGELDDEEGGLKINAQVRVVGVEGVGFGARF
jgi:RNA-binding protein 39